MLLEALETGNDHQLDLECAGEVDITVVQLLWAAAREADRTGARIVIRLSEAALGTAREAGLERFPGLAVQE